MSEATDWRLLPYRQSGTPDVRPHELRLPGCGERVVQPAAPIMPLGARTMMVTSSSRWSG
jgi:hypothetical protein